jgi:hypothetical protein
MTGVLPLGLDLKNVDWEVREQNGDEANRREKQSIAGTDRKARQHFGQVQGGVADSKSRPVGDCAEWQ